jgi:hypothetical protein
LDCATVGMLGLEELGQSFDRSTSYARFGIGKPFQQ